MIADQVPSGTRLADIGSDHALLPTYLAQRGIISYAVAGEVNPGPLGAAKRQVKETGLSGKIDVRGGNGLEVIEPGEVDVITIAGMGGALIVSILEAGKTKLDGVQKLILQPNVGEEHVRRWLDQQGWQLVSEMILEEDGKIYEILTAEAPSEESVKHNERLYRNRILSDQVIVGKDRLYQMGPFLLDAPKEVWFQKWESELDKFEMICHQLALSEAEASKVKSSSIAQEIQEIREVLACLQKAKL